MAPMRTNFSYALHVFLSLPLLSLGLACGPSFHDQQVMNAKQAQGRGDTVNAAASWDAACRAEPDDKESCRAAAAAADQVRTTSVQTATPACEQGDMDGCASALRDIRRLRPQDASVKAVLLTGMVAYRKKCEALENAGSLDSTLGRLNCVMQKARTVDDATYQTMVQEERDHAALVFATAAPARPPGASYTLLRTAQCLSRRIEPGTRTQAAAAAFVGASAQPIVVRVRNAGSVALSGDTLAPCNYVQTALGPRARCGDPALPTTFPDFTLDISVSLGRVAHRVTEEVRVARYQSGVEVVPNPERRSAEMEAHRAERSFESVEQETMDRKAACDRSRRPADCDRYNASVPVYNRRIQERDEARRRLAQTPISFEQPIFASAQYTVRHHTWATPFTIDGRSLAGEALRDAGTFTREDSENPSVLAAGIHEDPLATPTMEDFDRALRAAVVGSAKTALQRAFERRALCADKSWSLDSPDLECRAVSELYLKGPLPAPNAWLGSSVQCQ
jgi:hypothetical protein